MRAGACSSSRGEREGKLARNIPGTAFQEGMPFPTERHHPQEDACHTFAGLRGKRAGRDSEDVDVSATSARSARLDATVADVECRLVRVATR